MTRTSFRLSALARVCRVRRERRWPVAPPHLGSLRGRLLLVVLIALLPALAVGLYLDVDDRRLAAFLPRGAGQLARGVGRIGLVAALAMLGAWIAGDRLVRRPVRRLLALVLQGPSADTEPSSPSAQDELDELARAISRLNEELTERQRERDLLALELRRLEQKVVESNRIEAVGRLAGGVIHDFNNLLTVILGRTELLRLELQSDPRLSRDVELISLTGKRARALTSQLLAFSRRQHVEPKVVDLHRAVSSLSGMLQRLVGDSIELRLVLGGTNPRVKVEASQLEQVILNLAVNGRDAMPAGGRLTIHVRNAEIDDLAGCQLGHRAGRFVVIEVNDTGVGMEATTRTRIFEPFFTTKGSSRGTGLGLATVLGIVEQHHGCITVDSEPGRGSTFKIYLPETDELPEVISESAPADLEALTGTDVVLVVDDEDVVRTLASEILRMKGYAVLEASNGAEALRLVQREPGPIDLLLTDVVMPEMQGPELAKRVIALRPHTRVIHMSGYAFDIVPTWTLADADGFLPKPFTPETLARMVREALHRSGSPGIETIAG